MSVQRITLLMLNSSALNALFTWVAIHIISLHTSNRFLTILRNARAPEIKSRIRKKLIEASCPIIAFITKHPFTPELPMGGADSMPKEDCTQP